MNEACELDSGPVTMLTMSNGKVITRLQIMNSFLAPPSKQMYVLEIVLLYE